MGQAQTRHVETLDEDKIIHRGSGDFLADQGIGDTEEFRVKAHLCNEIAGIIESRSLTQEQAAKLTGQKQADISRVVNSRFDDYSVWRLIKLLAALNGDVMISVNPNGQGIVMSQTVDLDSQQEPAPVHGM